MDETVRVLIADDHAVVRQGLRLFLDIQPGIRVVGEATGGEDAVARAVEDNPDVVLMDVAMAGGDGIAATRGLREHAPGAKVLVLSTFSDAEEVLPALRAGASGYLTKDAQPDEIAEAVRAVARGEPVLCPQATRHLLAHLGGAGRRPEGTVTVLFTDIVGSTEVLERRGEEAAREAFRMHDRLVRESLARHGGVEVEREGDAFMVAFASARGAVLCAVDLQQSLARWAETQPDEAVRVRAGLNTGEVVAEGPRYFGRAVFVAARIAGRAESGQILVSELTRALVGDGGVAFLDAGLHELKGLKGSHRLFEVEWTPA